ncbi:enoyl-CoA hydratase/isomerase family protein [Amycolatopsis sp. K13G38]|uniref:Enoyl-CoA hydratase/isomerase family protein n=2 Tax=Amycolatopsis acididurans TaxID=2724524 RepID=A0ABX1JHN8_9PSEU|nr:enoyl-CoA hydratase/isomerase family protein [Amycolatopsis acididurans]
METGYVRVEVDRAVAVLTVDRPPANALDLQLVEQLSRAVTSLGQRGDVGAVVITGTGSRFVAGADIKMMRGLGDSLFPRFVSAIQRGFDDLERLALPTIAAVNGHAMGGGLELALACDLRFVAEGVRLGLPEVRLGLLPGAGGTQRLVETVGKGRALELLYTGRALTPEEGLRLGVVDRVVPADRLREAATDFAAELAGGARAALAAIKGAVLARLDGGRRAGFRTEADGVARLFGTPDAREGLAAFAEKRPARFGGTG